MTQDHLTDSIFGEPASKPVEAPPVLTRREIHGSRRRRRPPKYRRFVVLLISLALVVGAGYGAVQVLGPLVSRILPGQSEDVDFAGPGEGQVTIVVAPGDTGEAIATTLRDAGVTKTRTAYLQAAATDPSAAALIQAGSYTMKIGMRGIDAFNLLIDPANRNTGGVTVREGLWASETYTVLSEATGIPLEDYQKAAEDPVTLGLPEAAGGNIEGWLFPATYEFGEDDSAQTQLIAMIAKTVSVLEETGIPQSDWEKTMILASLVEAEAKLDEDRPKIARVFLNRIEDPGPPSYGLLQSDATITYGVGERSLFPTNSQLNDASNPYNTRIYPGLPPGPIDNPGRASILAAANPAEGPWFFFVAVNPISGETKYATTLEEHNANVAELNAYCDANPDDCG